jgi:putative hemolysin
VLTFTDIVLFAFMPLLLIGSAFFSGSETALFSLSAQQRTALTGEGSITGQTLKTLLSETRGLLITLLLSNMTVNTLFFVVSTVLLLRLDRQTSGGAGALIVGGLPIGTLLGVVLLGEVIPKLIAARQPERASRLVCLPLLVVHRILAPLRAAASVLVITPLARLIAPAEKPPDLSASELASLLELSRQRGVIDRAEEQLLQQVLELNQLKARNLMVPRVDVKAFDLDDPPHKLIELVKQTRLSHIPAYRGDIDQIKGVMYARDVLMNPPRTAADVLAMVKEVHIVPEQQRADVLLRELRRSGTTFVVVVDEYGGTAGIVTLEDVVEHMVGDIIGAYEQSGELEVQALGPGRWRISADLSIHDWADAFGGGETPPGVATVGGLVMALLGRLPRVGDRVRVGGVAMEVERMAGRRIDTITLSTPDAAVDLHRPASSSVAAPTKGAAP